MYNKGENDNKKAANKSIATEYKDFIKTSE